MGHFLLHHPMTTCECPIPWDSHENSNTKYIISCACLMSTLYRAMYRANPGAPMKIGSPVLVVTSKRPQPCFRGLTSLLHGTEPWRVMLTVLRARAWKNVNFPWAASWRRSPLYDVAKEICFLENVALKSLNYHCAHVGQLGLIQPTSIGSHSTCKQLHRRTVPWTQKRGTEGLQNRWKRQIFTATWQILAPNPCLTRF